AGETFDCGGELVDRTTSGKHCGFCGHQCEDSCREGFCVPHQYARLPELEQKDSYRSSRARAIDERYLYAQLSGLSPDASAGMQSWGVARPWDGGKARVTESITGFSHGLVPLGDDLFLQTEYSVGRATLDGPKAFERWVDDARGIAVSGDILFY